MLKKPTFGAALISIALLFSSGCKSDSSNTSSSSPSQLPAQTASSGTTASPAANTGSPGSIPQSNVATTSPTPAQVAAPAPPPPPPPIIIPAGTQLHVALVQALGSKLSQDGERFDTTFSSPVSVKGKKVIPAGTKAVGTVTEAHAAGRFKGGATLMLELNSIHLNGQIYSIKTTIYSSESKGKGKRTGAMIGGGTAGGALIGGLAGGGKGALIGGLIGAGAGTAGAATGNRDITLKPESLLSFQLASSLAIPAPASSLP